ncbi:MAG: metallophosphoesterase [Euryarchaeota archaeon]|nr:metallophosphoesterase [Euryarchaeota archaeon]
MPHSPLLKFNFTCDNRFGVPFIPVTFFHKDGTHAQLLNNAILDSGAYDITIPQTLSDLLGLKKNRKCNMDTKWNKILFEDEFISLEKISDQNLHQVLSEKMKVFVTSDHHFCHKNIIKYCRRPFDSVEEMDLEMIKKWNKKVSVNDLVFHLGDFALTNKTNLKRIRGKLNGTIIIIPGNHDRKRILKQSGFIVSITDTIRIKNIIFSHRPLSDIPDGYVNVHGHIHEKTTYGTRINICVDVTNYEPKPVEKYFKEATHLLSLIEFTNKK